MKPSAILTYHSLDDSGSVISTPPAVFRAQMEHLKRAPAPVVPLERLAEHPGGVAITFDDAYGNFYTEAFPVLRELGLPATVFVVTGYCGRTNQWPSPPAGIPVLNLMDWTQLREVASHGIRLGAHTVTHPHLTALAPAEAENEMARCRMELEDRTGYPVTAFAYPYGDCDETVRRAAARHFRLACTTEMGLAAPGADPLSLPRVDMYYMRALLVFRNLTTPAGRGYVRARHCMRVLRRSVAHRFL